MKAAGGGYFASGQHSGFDFNADSLTQSTQNSHQSEMEVETSAGSKRKRETSRIKASRQHQSLSQSGRRDDLPIYDGHLLANGGDQRLVSLSCKVGKRLAHQDHIAPFLANLQQNGRVITAWNGTFLESDIDKRMVTMQCFRHRMGKQSTGTTTADYADGNTVQAEYPGTTTSTGVSATWKPHILFPQNSDITTVNQGYMPNVTAPPGAANGNINNAFIQHKCGDVSFCAINRPDLEDMSWNLNKLKLDATPRDSDYPGFHKQVPLFDPKKHRRQSILQQNNFQAVPPDNLDPSSAPDDARLSPYVYKAVLRYGVIKYELMNKNDTGCHVEYIVYKIKKTASMSSQVAFYNARTLLQQYADTASPPTANTTNAAFFPLNKVVDAVSQGYINTVGDDYATENLQGRKPDKKDIYDNPAYPLLPTLRKTIASVQPCVEVVRNKFAMPAGSRRTFTVNLPGEVYNPCSIPLRGPTTAGSSSASGIAPSTFDTEGHYGRQLKSENISLLDEYSYCLVVAVNGQKMTRFFERPGVAGTYIASEEGTCPPGTALDAFSTIAVDQITPQGPGFFANGQQCGYQGPPCGPNDSFWCVDLNLPFFANWTYNGPNHFWVKDCNGTPARVTCWCVELDYSDPNWPSQLPPSWDYATYGWPWQGGTATGFTANGYIYINPTLGTYPPMVVDPANTGCGFVVSNTTSPPWDSCTGMCSAGNDPDWVTNPNQNFPIVFLQFLSASGNPAPITVPSWMYIRVGSLQPGIPGDPQVVKGAKPPTVFPMGDNYGEFHVDYCATYTEHIGACLYDYPKERNLYDCGMPNKPSIVSTDTTTKEKSRIILPARDAVRTAPQVTITVPSPNAINVNASGNPSEGYTASQGASQI